MPVIKRVGIISVAKITALIVGVIGLIMGIIFALIAGAFGAITGMPAWIHGLGIAAIIIFPILYAIGGFIYGAVIAGIYNITAGVVGGIDLEFQQ